MKEVVREGEIVFDEWMAVSTSHTHNIPTFGNPGGHAEGMSLGLDCALDPICHSCILAIESSFEFGLEQLPSLKDDSV